MKEATLRQIKRILSLLEDVPSATVQSVIESGELSKLFSSRGEYAAFHKLLKQYEMPMMNLLQRGDLHEFFLEYDKPQKSNQSWDLVVRLGKTKDVCFIIQAKPNQYLSGLVGSDRYEVSCFLYEELKSFRLDDGFVRSGARELFTMYIRRPWNGDCCKKCVTDKNISLKFTLNHPVRIY